MELGLEGMNVLIIGKPFFNYHELILNEFKQRGNDAIFLSETPVNHMAIGKIFGRQIERKVIKIHQRKVLKECLKNTYDMVLVLVGRYLDQEFMVEVKKHNPTAKFVLYLWDDIARVESFHTIKPFFDTIFSFDLKDCETNKEFVFLPLFYSQEYKATKRIKKYDIYGSFSEHSGRKEIAIKVYNECKASNVKCKFILFPGRYGYIKNYFKNKSIEANTNKDIEFVFSPISSQQNVDNVLASKALLDIQFPSQNGLTMRSLESIGASVKLITTNDNIKKYDFYSEKNQFVIDRENPHVDHLFLQSPFAEIPENIREKYSISTWVSVLSGEKELCFLKNVD